VPFPEETVDHVPPPITCTGELLVIVELSPIYPSLFCPQHQSVPSVLIAAELKKLTAIFEYDPVI